ncbi:MAG: hypothetical protein AUI14_04555 [Actinobacteria bacterium 13_2_20CM_2_71_6]|nr:MAG: hypothetical protein AUI14_04555 [Actinobacteria bacterium 13_2_20CM_2_71_6]
MSRINTAVLCEALFSSDLQASVPLEPQRVRAAIRRAILVLGVRNCAAVVAQEFGDHPDAAVARMLWAKEAVCQAYAPALPSPEMTP